MSPANDDSLKPGKDVNVVVILEPLGLVGRRLVLVEVPGYDHPELCDDEILNRVERWLEKSEWTLTRVLLKTDRIKGVDLSFDFPESSSFTTRGNELKRVCKYVLSVKIGQPTLSTGYTCCDDNHRI